MGQMLLAMSEVVFEVIALGFQGIVVLNFDLPAGASGLNDESYVLKNKRMVSDELILDKNLPVVS